MAVIYEVDPQDVGHAVGHVLVVGIDEHPQLSSVLDSFEMVSVYQRFLLLSYRLNLKASECSASESWCRTIIWILCYGESCTRASSIRAGANWRRGRVRILSNDVANQVCNQCRDRNECSELHSGAIKCFRWSLNECVCSWSVQ